jgi:hypothetical protein
MAFDWKQLGEDFDVRTYRLRVNRDSLVVGRLLPVFPAKQACQGPLGMSQTCRWRTFGLTQDQTSTCRVSLSGLRFYRQP